MKKNRKLTLACLPTLSLALLGVSIGSSAGAAEGASGLKFLSFRLAQESMFQRDGNFFTGNLAWTPRFFFSKGLGLRLHLGGTYTKSLAEEVSPVLEGMGYFALPVGQSFSVEIGAGVHSFVSNGGTRTAFGGNLVTGLGSGLLFFDHAFAGYTAVDVPQRMLHEIKVGVGTSF